MERPILLELERAELAARERRLAAEAEAERLVLAARAAADEIEAGTEAEIERAIEERRRALDESAAREIAETERATAALAEGRAGEVGEHDRRAVELVVACVLAEPDGRA